MSAYDVMTPAYEPPDTGEVSFGAIGDSGYVPSAVPRHVPPPRVSPEWLRENGATNDLYGHYAEPDPIGAVKDSVGGFFEWLSKKDGVQIDKDGIGGSTDDARFRFMPIIPYVTD